MTKVDPCQAFYLVVISAVYWMRLVDIFVYFLHGQRWGIAIVDGISITRLLLSLSNRLDFTRLETLHTNHGPT